MVSPFLIWDFGCSTSDLLFEGTFNSQVGTSLLDAETQFEIEHPKSQIILPVHFA